MNSVDFQLQPFGLPIPQIQIQGNVRREENTLRIRYRIVGDTHCLKIPDLLDNAARRDELWQKTCLEFFLGLKNSPSYWEFNLSPSGEWNVYALAGYRQGMLEEKAIAFLPFTVKNEPNLFQLELALDLTPIIEPDAELELGITAVIESKRGDISYWALAHCGREPDFHLRDSFQIEV